MTRETKLLDIIQRFAKHESHPTADGHYYCPWYFKLPCTCGLADAIQGAEIPNCTETDPTPLEIQKNLGTAVSLLRLFVNNMYNEEDPNCPWCGAYRGHDPEGCDYQEAREFLERMK